MWRVDQEDAIGIAIIFILVCYNHIQLKRILIKQLLKVCISPMMMVLVKNAVRAVQVRSFPIIVQGLYFVT